MPSYEQLVVVTSRVLITGHHNKCNNEKSLKYCENDKNVTQRQESSKCCWKNGAGRLAGGRVATNQLVRNATSGKHNEMCYAYNS